MKTLDVQNVKVPCLGFGTYKLYGDECARAVDFAIGTGYTHIDTAQVYDNEEGVGDGIQKSGIDRSKIFLTTKIWRNQFSAGSVLESVDESLRKLKTDYVDLLLVHWPFPETPIAKLVEGVMKAQEAGKTKLIGVSNFNVVQIEEAIRVSNGKIVNDQVEYHPYLNQNAVLGAVRKNNMFLTAYSPVARGLVTKDATLKEIGLKYGKSAGQVGLRWLIQQDRVAAIPKSATPENIKSNLAIFDFELTAEEMAKIHALARADGRQIDPDFAPKWDAAA